LSQTCFELLLEIVDINETLIARSIVAFRAFGPTPPYGLEELVLLHLFAGPIGAQQHVRGFAKQVDIRHAVVFAVHLDGVSNSRTVPLS
jgi:hypothetical protein